MNTDSWNDVKKLPTQTDLPACLYIYSPEYRLGLQEVLSSNSVTKLQKEECTVYGGLRGFQPQLIDPTAIKQ